MLKTLYKITPKRTLNITLKPFWNMITLMTIKQSFNILKTQGNPN